MSYGWNKHGSNVTCQISTYSLSFFKDWAWNTSRQLCPRFSCFILMVPPPLPPSPPCVTTSPVSPVSLPLFFAHLCLQFFPWLPLPLVLSVGSDSSTFPSREFFPHVGFILHLGPLRLNSWMFLGCCLFFFVCAAALLRPAACDSLTLVSSSEMEKKMKITNFNQYTVTFYLFQYKNKYWPCCQVIIPQWCFDGFASPLAAAGCSI